MVTLSHSLQSLCKSHVPNCPVSNRAIGGPPIARPDAYF